MRYLRITLIASGAAALLLAGGFHLRMPWATALWPLPDTRLSYLFISAILAGSAIPLLWVGVSDELGALVGYTLGFGVMYGGMALSVFQLSARDARTPLMVFGLATAVLAALLYVLLIWSRRYPIVDPRPMPRPLRIAFLVEIGVLLLVGAGLLLQIPNTLPWALTPESSVLYGWVFIGMALFFSYALLKPAWNNARGPLMGFLAYDVVLLVPFLQHFAAVRPEQLLQLIVATGIVIGSGALAVYYLCVNKTTRAWAVPGSPERARSRPAGPH